MTIKNLIGLILLSQFSFSQVVLSEMDIKQEHSTIDINQFNWLAAHWIGTGLGGQCDELWLPAVDNTMQGVFRFHINNKIIFTEYMVLEKLDDNFYLKIKHFNKDLSTWEEKNEWTIFPFIKLDKETAYFNGLTFVRKKNKLNIYLSMKKNNIETIETFKFYKN